jgi:hypothetical protein
MLSTVLQSLLPSVASGGTSPQVQALETQNANQINKTSSTTGDAMQRFLASRGFGQSGQSGQVALQTELGRQAALGANGSNAAGLQLQQNNQTLADALNFAFNTPGSSTTKTGSTFDTGTGSATASGSSSNWGFGGGVST